MRWRASLGHHCRSRRRGGFAEQRETSRQFGEDLRYPLSGELTLDLTYNTDFAQVEADDQQVDLDRFPLFYPGRRRFFQEGSDLFDFSIGGVTSNRLDINARST